MIMVIWGMMTWWYTEGWYRCLGRVKDRLVSTLDYFSFELLVTTLFAPFRQISAGKVRGPIDVQIRAFFDQLISRFIGTMVRLVVILVGALVMVANVIMGALFIVSWLLVPIMPLVGIIIFAIGWVPWAS